MSLFHVWEDCGYCIWEQSFPQMCVKLSLETVFSGRHCKCAYPKLFSYMKWCLCLKIPPQNSAFHSHKTHTEKGTGNMLYVKKAWREQGGKLCNDTFWGNTGRLLVLQNTRWRWDSKVSSLTYFRTLSPRQILLLYEMIPWVSFWLMLSFLADSHGSPREDTPTGSMDSLSSQSPTPAFSSSPPGLLDENHLIMDSGDLAGWTTHL